MFQREKMNKEYGLFCVTPVSDNMLMWAHYANSHKGFCVGFDSQRLFPITGGRGCDIVYSDKYPEISPMLDDIFELFIHQTNTKAKFWAHEIEYRIFKNVNGSRIISLPVDVITEVIFGCNTPRQHKDEIIKIVGKLYPHVQLFQAKPKSRSFELEIVPISQ